MKRKKNKSNHKHIHQDNSEYGRRRIPGIQDISRCSDVQYFIVKDLKVYIYKAFLPRISKIMELNYKPINPQKTSIILSSSEGFYNYLSMFNSQYLNL